MVNFSPEQRPKVSPTVYQLCSLLLGRINRKLTKEGKLIMTIILLIFIILSFTYIWCLEDVMARQDLIIKRQNRRIERLTQRWRYARTCCVVSPTDNVRVLTVPTVQRNATGNGTGNTTQDEQSTMRSMTAKSGASCERLSWRRILFARFVGKREDSLWTSCWFTMWWS